jgi:cyclopropane fatty-acyl-phospholipid synthase-like methyltransferase
VLRASRRLLRPGGRVAFHTISVTPGLSRADHRRAMRAGPPAADDKGGSELLARAGFIDVREYDVTEQYAATARAWREARLRHRDELRPLDPAAYDDRIARGAEAIAAVGAGLLRRTLHVARRDGRDVRP